MSEPTPTQGTDLRELARLSTVLPSNGPRYTSYPTANLFTEQHLESKFRSTWQQHGSDTISLYVHVPFCAKVCFYCACNKIHTANRAHAETYLGYLLRELEQHAQILSNTGAQQKQIDQLHFGGGTPTTLSYHHMQQLFDQLRCANNDATSGAIIERPRAEVPAVEMAADQNDLILEIGTGDLGNDIARRRIRARVGLNIDMDLDRAAGQRPG